MLAHSCLLGPQRRYIALQDENGNKVTWGGDGTLNEEIWGPEGWCEAEQPSIRSAFQCSSSTLGTGVPGLNR